MNATIWTVIASVLSIVIGLWGFWGRRSKYKREQAEKAKEELDNAHKNKDESSILDAWDRINRL